MLRRISEVTAPSLDDLVYLPCPQAVLMPLRLVDLVAVELVQGRWAAGSVLRDKGAHQSPNVTHLYRESILTGRFAERPGQMADSWPDTTPEPWN